jgi:hypothetical protein
VSEPTDGAAPDPGTLVLGERDLEFGVDRAEPLGAVTLALAAQARRTLDIVSRHLDPSLFDREDFVDAVKSLALSSRRAEIRLLVLDPAPVVLRGHRLVQLAQRLSSFIQLRVPSAEHREFNEAWVVADNTGYVHRRFSDRFEGTANFADPRHAARLTNRFDEIWQRANPDPNLRRLHL